MTKPSENFDDVVAHMKRWRTATLQKVVFYRSAYSRTTYLAAVSILNRRGVNTEAPTTVNGYPIVYTSVNEEGEVYDRHTNIMDAIAMLEQFPNDSVVITVGESRMKRRQK